MPEKDLSKSTDDYDKQIEQGLKAGVYKSMTEGRDNLLPAEGIKDLTEKEISITKQEAGESENNRKVKESLEYSDRLRTVYDFLEENGHIAISPDKVILVQFQGEGYEKNVKFPSTFREIDPPYISGLLNQREDEYEEEKREKMEKDSWKLIFDLGERIKAGKDIIKIKDNDELECFNKTIQALG